MHRGIEYLSDPLGQITFTSNAPLQHEKQGSEQATFLSCVKCQTTVGVCYIGKNTVVGSLNATLLDKFESLQASELISPKQLAKTEKVKRWKGLWSEVLIVDTNDTNSPSHPN